MGFIVEFVKFVGYHYTILILLKHFMFIDIINMCQT